jgi:hypothetical protein
MKKDYSLSVSEVMTQWEYLKDYYSNEKEPYAERLSEYGKDGWELCGLMPDYDKFYFHVQGYTYIFKRPKQ